MRLLTYGGNGYRLLMLVRLNSARGSQVILKHPLVVVLGDLILRGAFCVVDETYRPPIQCFAVV